MSFLSSSKIFLQLFYRDLLILKKEIVVFVLDSLAWPIRAVVIWGYIMPSLGVSSGYGMFYFAGMIVTSCITKIMYGLSKIFDDLEGNKLINYELTLGLSSNLVLIRKALALSLNLIILGFVVLPVGLIVLLPQVEYLKFNIGKFVLIFVLICLMIGFATLWFSSWIKNSFQIGSIWSRYLHTLWLFGCSFYPWKLFYSMFPFWGLLNLLNPVTYAMEGVRSSMLNSSDYIDYWVCVIAIFIFTVYFALRGINLFKKRLDVI